MISMLSTKQRPSLQPRSSSRLRWIVLVGLLGAMASVDVPSARAGDTVDGRVVFWRTSRVATPVMGRIASMPVRVGDRVKKGDVLAEIDTQQLKADLAIAQSSLAFARSDLAGAEARLQVELSEFERIAKLKDSPAYSGARFEDANNRVAVANAAVATARSLIGLRQAEVAKRELDVRLATIEAPFDGVVIRHLLTVGGLVSIEDPHILVMVDDKSPEIEIDVPVDQAARLSVGRQVDFSVGGGAREQATVRAVMPSDTPNAKTRLVRLDLTNGNAPVSDIAPVTVFLPRS